MVFGVAVASRSEYAIANAILAIVYTGAFHALVWRYVWPWDWRGERKARRRSEERS